MRRAYQRSALGALLVLGSFSASAWAQAPAEPQPLVVDDATRAAVRRLGGAGTSAYVAGDYELASERLDKAFQLMPVPSLGLWSARALVKCGLWTRAAERYLSVKHLDFGPGDGRVQRESQQTAAREWAELVPRIPSVRVKLEGAAVEDVTVSIDGVALPQLLLGEQWPLDPGAHRVVGTRAGESVEERVKLSEGEHIEVVLPFSSVEEPSAAPLATLPQAAAAAAAPAEPLPPSPQPAAYAVSPFPWRSAGWVTLGVGGATLLGSAIAGLWAGNKHDELTSSDQCLGNDCLESSDVGTYNTLVDVATVGWISGAVLATGGGLMLLVAPSPDKTLNVSVGPTGASVYGRF